MAEFPDVYELLWSRRSALSLRRAIAYIADHNPSAAELLLTEILERVEQLKLLPRTGSRMGQAFPSEVRQVVIRPYRVIYRIDDVARQIAILRVWHGSRREPTFDELGL